jgi:carboxylesterase type B
VIEGEAPNWAGHKNLISIKGIEPVGARRFIPPVKPEPWTGIRTTEAGTSSCPETQIPASAH